MMMMKSRVECFILDWCVLLLSEETDPFTKNMYDNCREHVGAFFCCWKKSTGLVPQANRATVITTVFQSIQLISYYWFSITCVGRHLKCVGKIVQDILSTYIQPLSVVLLTTSRHLFIWLSSSGQPNHFLATEELLIVQFALKWYYIF